MNTYHSTDVRHMDTYHAAGTEGGCGLTGVIDDAQKDVGPWDLSDLQHTPSRSVLTYYHSQCSSVYHAMMTMTMIPPLRSLCLHTSTNTLKFKIITNTENNAYTLMRLPHKFTIIPNKKYK